MALWTVLIDDDQLASFDVTDIIRSDDIESTAFGGKDVGLAKFAKDQWTNSERITDTD